MHTNAQWPGNSGPQACIRFRGHTNAMLFHPQPTSVHTNPQACIRIRGTVVHKHAQVSPTVQDSRVVGIRMHRSSISVTVVTQACIRIDRHARTTSVTLCAVSLPVATRRPTRTPRRIRIPHTALLVVRHRCAFVFPIPHFPPHHRTRAYVPRNYHHSSIRSSPAARIRIGVIRIRIRIRIRTVTPLQPIAHHRSSIASLVHPSSVTSATSPSASFIAGAC